MRVTALGAVTQYVTYAAKLFEEGKVKIVIKATGLAIQKGVQVNLLIFSTRFECSFTSFPLVSNVDLKLPHSFQCSFKS